MAEQLVNTLGDDPLGTRSQAGLSDLAKANLMAAGLEVADHKSAVPKEIADFMDAIARVAEEINVDGIMRDVNKDRAIAGFPEVRDIAAVESEIEERRKVYKHILKDFLNEMASNALIETMTLLLEQSTGSGETHAPALIDELIDSYAVETQQFLEHEAESAEKLIAAARENAAAGETKLSVIVDHLERVLRNWDKVAQPLQLSFKARGLDHEGSKSLAYKVRSLAVDLFNEHDDLHQSMRLNKLLKELFFKVPDILERVEGDAKALADISTRREESLAIDPIRSLCKSISTSVASNPSLAHHEGQRLLDEGKALLRTAPIEATSPTYMEARDLLAATLMHCAITYGNHTSKWEPCIRLLRDALDLADDAELKKKLRENLVIGEGYQTSLGALEPVKSAPSLRTINGIGVALYGNTDLNPSDGSYMATYYLVFLFIPVFPLARYRVISSGNSYRFLGQGTLRTFDKWHIAISLGLIALMFLKG